MLELIKEPLTYIAFLIFLGIIIHIWDKLEKHFKAQHRRKEKYSCRNREMRKLIRKKDMYDFHNIALRYNNYVAAQATELEKKPIRKMTGFLSEDFL